MCGCMCVCTCLGFVLYWTCIHTQAYCNVAGFGYVLLLFVCLFVASVYVYGWICVYGINSLNAREIHKYCVPFVVCPHLIRRLVIYSFIHFLIYLFTPHWLIEPNSYHVKGFMYVWYCSQSKKKLEVLRVLQSTPWNRRHCVNSFGLFCCN